MTKDYPIASLLPDELSASGDYDPEHDKLDPRLIGQLQTLARPMVRYFRTEVEGLENLPWDSGCLCVSNHAVLGLDSAVLFAAVHERTGRMLRGLGEHVLFKLPLISHFFVRFGAVDGNRDNAVRLLRNGEWAICYPGGVNDSFKRPEDRYRLKWHNRLGYLRCALAAGVPIVPIAGIGIDDAFITIGREHRLGRRLLGGPTYDLPILVGLGLMPLPVKFRFIFAPPIDPRRFGLTEADADAPVEELLPAHADIWSHTQGLIDQGLAGRKSRFF